MAAKAGTREIVRQLNTIKLIAELLGRSPGPDLVPARRSCWFSLKALGYFSCQCNKRPPDRLEFGHGRFLRTDDEI